MKTNLYIPKKIIVGFQNRHDTYNGKLACVVYQDEKGVIRKQSSWDNWRDKTIQEMTYDNQPTNFIFNKGVQRHSYFGPGRSVMRIYDTREFEFEISIDNLVGILMYSDVSKRDIQEKCVFAWHGKDLILLPVNSEEYQESLKYTEKQFTNISTKELVKGFTYETKKTNTQLIYMGYHNFYQVNKYYLLQKEIGKKHIFYNPINKIFVTPSISTIAQVTNNEIHPQFPQLNEILHNSANLIKIKDYTTNKITKVKLNNKFYKKYNNDIILIQINSHHNSKTINPGDIIISLGNIVKNKNSTSLCFNLNTNKEKIDEIYKMLTLDWTIQKTNNPFIFRKTTGTPIPTEKFIEILKNFDIGDKVLAITENDKVINLN